MSSAIEIPVAECSVSGQAAEYLRTLRPADDLTESYASNRLTLVDDDPDATARLPTLDIDSLSSGLRANLGDID